MKTSKRAARGGSGAAGAGPSRALRRAAALAAVLICPVLGCKLFIPDTSTPGRKVIRVADSGSIEVERPDGEGSDMIRLQGFTPRSYTGARVEGEPQATLRSMLEGKRVHLEFDQPFHPWYADNNEILAYVFVDGKLINAELLRRGLGAYDDTWHPIRYQEQMLGAQDEARGEKRGIWEKGAQPAPVPTRISPPPDAGGERDYNGEDDRDRDTGPKTNVYERQYEDEYGNDTRDY